MSQQKTSYVDFTGAREIFGIPIKTLLIGGTYSTILGNTLKKWLLGRTTNTRSHIEGFLNCLYKKLAMETYNASRQIRKP